MSLLDTPFADAWSRAEQIAGWLSQAEARLLYDAAISRPREGTIIEIGSYRGKSTALLASSGRNVAAIDPLSPNTGTSDGYSVVEADAMALADVVSDFPNLRWLRCKVEDVAPDSVGAIDLLYIDGNHQSPHPINNFRRFQRHLKQGSLVAFHDYGDRPAVGAAIGELEREGVIEKSFTAGTMYVGRVINGQPNNKIRVFIGLPYNANIEPITWDSLLNALTNQGEMEIFAWRSQWSLLNRSFNDCLEKCHRRGDCDYFLLLHSDVGLSGGWLPQMVGELESHGLDALHAVVPIKNQEGLTSTAVAYSDDEWALVRRITTKELQRLPTTFDIETLRQCYDTDAKIILPNTGCLLLKYGGWIKDFPGFSNLDRMSRRGEAEWTAETVPEDWHFGYWAAANGVKVGGTRAVTTTHVGRHNYCSNVGWGHEIDRQWKNKSGAA